MEGQRFGSLVVLGLADTVGKHKRWLCRCDCGKETVVWQLSLRRGSTQSCGCLKDRMMKERWERYRHPAFWARIEKSDACWNWLGSQEQGPKNTSPYGVLRWRGKASKAHRVAYELTNGEIPAGMMVLHKCDNTLCCNPDHLYLGTHADNMRDMRERNRRKGTGSGASNGRAKLTQEQVNEIRARYESGVVSQQALADSFGVSQHAISMIVRNKRYV